VVAFAMPLFPVDSKTVSYKSGDETVHAVLYTPSGKGPVPGLVVIHEWWGLNDWVKEQASKLAEKGYASLAIDLYRGKVATTPDEAHQIMRGVPEDRAKRDLNAAFDYLASQSNVKKDRIAPSAGVWVAAIRWMSLSKNQPSPPTSSIMGTSPPIPMHWRKSMRQSLACSAPRTKALHRKT